MNELIETFFNRYFEPQISKILSGFINFGAIGTAITIITKYLYSLFLKRKNNLNLKPYYTNSVLKSAKKKYIRSKCQNIDPSNEIEYNSNFAFVVREDLLNFFLKNVFRIKDIEQKFYLILGDAGMGKTTFLLNLFRLYNKNIRNIAFSDTKIKLLPLGENFDELKKIISEISDPEKTILLLDALDESNLFFHEQTNNYALFFDKLINLVSHFKQVIITCRTNFFINEKDEPFELKIKKYNTEGNGFHIIKKVYLSPFNQTDVNKYLHNTFPFWEIEKKEKAKKIILSTKDIFFRPMLLSYIEDLVKLNRSDFLKFEVYETLIEAWIDRESKKYFDSERYIFKNNLYFFTYELAISIYNNYKENGYFISFEESQAIAVRNNINLNELEIRSRTLLNRNSNGDYKFSHKTILECILSYFSFLSRKHIVGLDEFEIFYDLENFDFAKNLVEELHLNYKRTFKLPNIYESDMIANEHISKVIKEKYKNKNPTIVWQNGSKYRVHLQDIG
ncbi:hypothetical protein C1637_05700 [Chryseobacterium lactis]|uniref:Novel STAND NTPase 3 domain-containing protein n=1 Tax=Chryseobacterium lactis TaxID=1241981 RepID=A0A3G6RI41_CHRLC|nr:AAA family ATPase [Chryseobacterium lactis]AZA84334.1 hypothetical protein EG342_21670 [Chryseobacterium lactis]AZB04722.1 hypothetical protein EG341_12550 [Chryseobacterium lactis]PNW14453.1 hypothetical protein C1637_05700 [Chryseobacterium lactis]